MRWPVIGILTLLIISTSALSMCIGSEDEENILTIFHAGSLAGPFGELEDVFEDENSGIDVRREASGSAAAIRKVTELDKIADIVASADYSLIESMMMENDPIYAEWYIQFAKNQMTIAYTDYSVYKDEINQGNWFEVLDREDVRFGFSNPNDDPCGYRSLMVVQLAELHYDDDTLFNELIEDNTGISSSFEDGVYNITIPESPDIDPDTDRIMMRSAEVDLMAALEIGEIDYLLIYRSVAYQHEESGVHFMELPEEIDLSSVAQKDFYKQVKVTQSSGNIVTAKPIVYGVTIPTNAKNRGLAEDFIEKLLGETGQEVFNNNGQPPITPGVASDKEALPESLKSYVVE